MFGSVNRDQHEFVLGGDTGNWMAVDVHRALVPKIILDGQWQRKVPKRAFCMQFENDTGCRAEKKILTWSFSATDSLGWDPRLIPCCNKNLGSARSNVDVGLEAVEELQLEYGSSLVQYGVALGNRWAKTSDGKR